MLLIYTYSWLVRLTKNIDTVGNIDKKSMFSLAIRKMLLYFQ